MTERKRIACFFTGGYTEVNAMKVYLSKVNGNVDYIQLCPVGTRKSRLSIKTRSTIAAEQSGLTGPSLIDFVLTQIKDEKYHFSDEQYDAILIEDDKDNRFLSKLQDGTADIDIAEWQTHKQNVTNSIHAFYPGIPVLFIYAAPEIEAWFLADWNNSFAKVYKTERILSTTLNETFSIRFHQHINNHIVTTRYKNALESYGYFGGTYRKLSEEIQKALGDNDFLKDQPCHQPVHYSKRTHGELMLEEIDPEKVCQVCGTFFREGYLGLAQL